MILFDKYLVLDLISNKEDSKVYLVNNNLDNKQYIVKALYKNILKDYMLKQYYKEVDILKKINNEYIPKFYEVIETSEWLYIVLDYIEGINLERYTLENNIVENEALLLFEKLTNIVNYLHTGFDRPIIHRDIKPNNIIINDNKLYLTDFGSVRYYDNNKTKDTVKLGTKGYAAPEQYNDNAQTDVRTDIYGIGITMYYLLTKHDPSEPPYEIYPIRYHNKDYSEGLELLIKKCIKLNPDDRYQNCNELLNDIEMLIKGEDDGN